MYPHQLWVLHSPYPDGTWRGLEKCSATPDGPRMFDSKESAEAALDGLPPYFSVVEVTLLTPAVRDPLSAATFLNVKSLIP